MRINLVDVSFGHQAFGRTARPPITSAHYYSAFAVDEKRDRQHNAVQSCELGCEGRWDLYRRVQNCKGIFWESRPSTETVGAQAFSDPMVSRAITLARPMFAGPPQSAERNCSVFRMLAEAFVRTIKRDYVRVSSCGSRDRHPHKAFGYR